MGNEKGNTIEIIKELEEKVKFSNQLLVQIKFTNKILKDDWEYNNFSSWFSSRFVENPIEYDKEMNIIGAKSTVDKVLEFLGLREEFQNYNDCLEKLDRLKINYDRNAWKPIYK